MNSKSFRLLLLRLMVDAVIPYLLKNLVGNFHREKDLWASLIARLAEVGHAEFVNTAWDNMPKWSFVTDFFQDGAVEDVSEPVSHPIDLVPTGPFGTETMGVLPDGVSDEGNPYRSIAGKHSVHVVCPSCSSDLHVSLDHVLTVDGRWDPPA